MQNQILKRPQENIRTGGMQHLINIFKAACATAPFCGGIAQLMSDYMPSVKMQRIEEFSQRLIQDLERLKDKIDSQTICSEEFMYIFENCYKGVSENYQKEKLEAFRGILLNSLTDMDATQNEKEYFLNLVTNLSVLHLKILKLCNNPEYYINSDDYNFYSVINEQVSYNESRKRFDIHLKEKQLSTILFPGIEFEMINNCYRELGNDHLIRTNVPPEVRFIKSELEIKEKSIFISYVYEKIREECSILTPYGKKFIQFLSPV